MRFNLSLIRKFLWFCARLFNKENRGYSGDLLNLFSSTLQIGYGVLGEKYIKNNKSRDPDTRFLVSNLDDVILNSNGFRLSRIGKYKTGLAKFWHGVSISYRNNNYYKNVPIFVKRPKLPKSVIYGEAISIDYKNNIFFITCNSKENREFQLFAQNLVFAAGPLENTRLLADFFNAGSHLSDHEIGRFGVINFSEFKQLFSPSIFGQIIFSRKVLRRKIFSDVLNDEVDYLIEARPSIGNNRLNQLDFYLDQTKGILYKILTQFSFKRLNEAFYNKFGFCIKTKEFEIYLQILSKNCITYNKRVFNRSRLSNRHIDIIKKDLMSIFKSISFNNDIELIDGLHMQGGKELFQILQSNKQLCNKIQIVGSPTPKELESLHNTTQLYFIDN